MRYDATKRLCAYFCKNSDDLLSQRNRPGTNTENILLVPHSRNMTIIYHDLARPQINLVPEVSEVFAILIKDSLESALEVVG